MDSIAEKLDKMVDEDLTELSQMTLGSETRKEMQKQFIEMYELRLEDKKAEQERKVQSIDQKIKIIFNALGLAIPNGIALYSVIKVMEFEEKGFVKSFSGRRVLGWIKPLNLLKMLK